MGDSEVEEQPIRRSLWNEGIKPQGVVGGGSEGGCGGGDDQGSVRRDGARKGDGYGDGGDRSREGGGGGGVDRDRDTKAVKLSESGGPITGGIWKGEAGRRVHLEGGGPDP